MRELLEPRVAGVEPDFALGSKNLFAAHHHVPEGTEPMMSEVDFQELVPMDSD